MKESSDNMTLSRRKSKNGRKEEHDKSSDFAKQVSVTLRTFFFVTQCVQKNLRPKIQYFLFKSPEFKI